MKKILIALFAIVAISTAANAQNNAIGARLGAGTAYGAEISYQGRISDFNRFEADLGMNTSSAQATFFSLAGIYQWHWFIQNGFGAYIGPGAQAVIVADNFGIGVGGQFGVDYQFDAPIQLSLDIRPMYKLFGNTQFYYSAALGVRYTF